MARKLVSFDPDAPSGSKLPSAVQTELEATYAPLGLVPDTIHYDGSGQVDYAIAGGIRTDYTWNADGSCHTETSQGLVKTWTYDGSGNPISSTVTEV